MQEQEHDNKELCTNGCGFFGAPASGGMCSVCWKKHVSNQQAKTQSHVAAPSSSSVEVEPKVLEKESASTSVVKELKEEEAKEEEKPVQKNKKRCWECKKKVGYTGIECRCGYVYCGSHRYADQHDCTFDFKKADRAELAKRNPGGGAFSKMEKL